ncbi:hypothetical protein P3X46_004707 [Hevea brasiliensis]|uniref:Uncharacterized protein n=1 Tax=Hevea brasiliensis TaxID=3981 RepID=A0ABQ9N073_HEVBR|nr:uncharacterized protein LOC110660011 isoform X2 [Hevea brasiliensis]KAJ9185030.1 hypothetical protein P3X46_004707 [Hevea brasiliensis]
MEKMGPSIGSRYSDFTKSFKLAIRSLLTSCSKEEFVIAFSNFSSAEQESLHRLFIQVITSLHKMIEDEFESLSLETQVGTTLYTVDQLVEEQYLDPLFLNKTNVMDVACNLSRAKKNEIQFLMGMLEKAEEQNSLIRARLEQLKKRRQNVTGTTDVEKLRNGILNY